MIQGKRQPRPGIASAKTGLAELNQIDFDELLQAGELPVSITGDHTWGFSRMGRASLTWLSTPGSFLF